MGNQPRTEETIIKIRTLVHKGTNALLAVSDELRGFMVAGATLDEVERKLEGAIRDHFEMMGCEVVSVTVSSEEDDIVGFESNLPAFIAHASFGEKHAA
jgi:hypothetical protein